MTKRILAIGLAEADLTDTRAAQIATAMPVLTRLKAQGVHGKTLAIQPLASKPLWASVFTGVEPQDHGIWGNSVRNKDGSRARISPKNLMAPPLWTLLEENGLSVSTFNVDLLEPTQGSKGFHVFSTGRPGVEPDQVFPPATYQGLCEKFGAWTVKTRARAKDDWASILPAEIEEKSEVLSDLLATHSWDFAAIRIVDLAQAQHRFWGDNGQTLTNIYKALDALIERIVTEAGPETTVFVFSECGAGPIRYAVDLNTWLEAEGFLVRQKTTVGALGTVLARLHKNLRKFIPKSLKLTDLKFRVRSRISDTGIDWTRTKAYALGDTSEIYLNVPPENRKVVLEDIKSRLLTLKDPSGNRAIEDVLLPVQADRVDHIYPDALIVWDDDAYMPMESFEKEKAVFCEWNPEFPGWTYPGCHRRHGMLVVQAPGAKASDIGTVNIVDFVPTWLELLGVGTPSHITGASFANHLK